MLYDRQMNHRTEVSDELLCRIHILEQLLEKLVGKPLFHRGAVLLHVLKAPGEMRDIQSERQRTERQTDTQTERQTDTQTERHTDTDR